MQLNERSRGVDRVVLSDRPRFAFGTQGRRWEHERWTYWSDVQLFNLLKSYGSKSSQAALVMFGNGLLLALMPFAALQALAPRALASIRSSSTSDGRGCCLRCWPCGVLHVNIVSTCIATETWWPGRSFAALHGSVWGLITAVTIIGWAHDAVETAHPPLDSLRGVGRGLL